MGICSPLVQLFNCQGEGSSSSGFWQRSYGYHWEPSLPTLDLNSSVSSCYWRTCCSRGTLAAASSWAPLLPSPLSCRVSRVSGATEGVGVPCCLWSLAGSWNLCPKGRKEPRRKLKNGARRYSTGIFNFKPKQHAKCSITSLRTLQNDFSLGSFYLEVFSLCTIQFGLLLLSRDMHTALPDSVGSSKRCL